MITPEFVYETYRNVIKGVESYRLNNRLLDVGCGAGALLEIAGEMNWEAVGVEISNSAAEFVRSRKLNVFEGTLEQAAFPENHFDVITCTEVLEHVTNSKELISEMSRILNPKGVLWITTPNSCGISGKLLGTKWRDIHPPEHLTLFSTKSLKMCLEEAGFKKFHFVSSGVNPFDIYKHLTNPISKRMKNWTNGNSKINNNECGNELNHPLKNCQLNEWFVSGKGRKAFKDLINTFLTATKLGDTIKVWATFE